MQYICAYVNCRVMAYLHCRMWIVIRIPIQTAPQYAELFILHRVRFQFQLPRTGMDRNWVQNQNPDL